VDWGKSRQHLGAVSTDSRTFDHLEDRNIGVYDVMKEGRSGFEPSARVPYRKAKSKK
jgi:hypothetical protein